MRRIILILLAGLSLTACTSAPNGEKVVVNGNTYYREEDKYYFRDSIWGMTPEDIIELEGREPDDDNITRIDRIMTYNNVQVNDIEATVKYWFGSETNELYSAYYSFERAYEDGTSYIDDFNNLESALIELYGEPTEKNDVVPEKYSDGLSEIPVQALIDGEMSYSHVWESGDTRIELALGPSISDTVELQLDYLDAVRLHDALNPDWALEEQKEEEQKARKDTGGL